MHIQRIPNHLVLLTIAWILYAAIAYWVITFEHPSTPTISYPLAIRLPPLVFFFAGVFLALLRLSWKLLALNVAVTLLITYVAEQLHTASTTITTIVSLELAALFLLSWWFLSLYPSKPQQG